MPALVLFGRQWSIGTDDFVLPSSWDSVIRLAWMIAAIIVYWVDVHNLADGFGGKYIKLYFYGHFALIPSIWALDIWLQHVSLRGGVMETRLRRHVPLILYLRILGELMSLGWNICGILWFWNDPFGCSDIPNLGLRKRIRCFVILNMMSAVFFALCWVSIFDPLGREYLKIKSFDEIESDISELPDTRRSRYWERRFRVYYWGFPYLPCLKNKETREGFKEVGKFLAHFVGDNDLVMTDFLVGLITLPKLELDKAEFVLSFLDQNANPIGPHVRRSKILKPKHFYRYITITYGWRGLVGLNEGKRVNAFRQIWKQLRFCAKIRPRPDGAQIEGDNWWHCQTACLKKFMKLAILEDVDLIYASFFNDYYQTPFCLTVDHRYKSYVVTFRGSASSKDLITCMTAWPVPIGIPGISDTFLVHHGFLMTAKNAKQKLQRYLEKLRSVFPDYRLVLTGYSMGAGVASVLGMILKPHFPRVRVYAFSPPGGIFNLEASIWSRSFITTLVHPGDLIPCLSLHSLENYVPYVIKAIHECKVPKFKVIQEAKKSGFFRMRAGQRIPLKSQVPVQRSNAENEFQIRKYDSDFILTDTPPKTQGSLPIMYLPGKVLKVQESSSERHEIFSVVNPESFLKIWTFTSIFEQYREHSPVPVLAGFYRFAKLGESNGESDGPIPETELTFGPGYLASGHAIEEIDSDSDSLSDDDSFKNSGIYQVISETIV